MKAIYLDRKGKWTEPQDVAKVLALAGKKIRPGKGSFGVTRDARALTKEKLTRAGALKRLRTRVQNDNPGHVYRVRNGVGNIVYSMRTVKNPATTSAARAKMVRECRWGIAHQGPIHYAQVRPIRFAYHQLPWSTDCSGSTIAFAKWAGAPDPSGFHFNGQGSTDYILKNCKKIDKRDALPGDLVLWAVGADGKHVAVVLNTDGDPLLESHGYEAGPLLIRFSSEDRYHGGETVHWLRFIP